MQVKLVSYTATDVLGKNGHLSGDELISYTARVSNPSNQLNVGTAPKLLAYLIKHKHWSPFEMANMCVEIKTSRAIAAQILRHRSFSFQEFSQRYSKVPDNAFEEVEIRERANVNRQSSTEVNYDWGQRVIDQENSAHQLYQEMVEGGIATECARMVLPLSTKTTMYMNGTIRSWIHYLEQRCDEHTQKEHREIALAIREVFKQAYPDVYNAIWKQ